MYPLPCSIIGGKPVQRNSVIKGIKISRMWSCVIYFNVTIVYKFHLSTCNIITKNTKNLIQAQVVLVQDLTFGIYILKYFIWISLTYIHSSYRSYSKQEWWLDSWSPAYANLYFLYFSCPIAALVRLKKLKLEKYSYWKWGPYDITH